MKYHFHAGTQYPVSRLSQSKMIAGVVVATATVMVFPDLVTASVDTSATTADGIAYIPKLIQEQLNKGGKAIMALGGGILAAATMAMTGPTVPKVGGGLAVGAVAGFGADTVLGISGSAII